MTVSYPTQTVHGLPYLDLCPAAQGALFWGVLRHRQGFAVFTPNATIAAACDRDRALFRMIAQADLLLPDGIGIVKAARREKHPLTARLPGIDAGETVLAIAAACPDRESVFFLGGKPGVAERAAAHWQSVYPGLKIAGTHHGYFEKTALGCDRVREIVAASGATIVFVCLGFPQQERFILESRSELPHVKLWMGLGGSLDVWAGERRRAPRPVQAMHLEWLWRGLSAPAKLRELPGMLRFVLRPADRIAGKIYR